jgi:hypothetical protein
MLLTHYYAIAACAGLLTGAWLFRPQERTAITTLGAFLAWGLTALLGGATETYADAGGELRQAADDSYHAVSVGEELVAAPVPDEIRLFATLWALLSALALVLYVWGVYPPASEEPVDQAAGVDT